MNKLLKKASLASLALGTLLAISPVLADTNIDSDDTEGSSDVVYVVGEKYTVVIPETITLTDNDGVNGTTTLIDAVKILVTNNALKIETGKKIQVSIKTGENFKLKTTGDDDLSYTVHPVSDATTALAAEGVVAEAEAGTVAETETSYSDPDLTLGTKTTLYFVSGAPKLAGTYTDTLNFTIDPDVAV
jgi:hypothetical protein